MCLELIPNGASLHVHVSTVGLWKLIVSAKVFSTFLLGGSHWEYGVIMHLALYTGDTYHISLNYTPALKPCVNLLNALVNWSYQSNYSYQFNNLNSSMAYFISWLIDPWLTIPKKFILSAAVA